MCFFFVHLSIRSLTRFHYILFLFNGNVDNDENDYDGDGDGGGNYDGFYFFVIVSLVS